MVAELRECNGTPFRSYIPGEALKKVEALAEYATKLELERAILRNEREVYNIKKYLQERNLV